MLHSSKSFPNKKETSLAPTGGKNLFCPIFHRDKKVLEGRREQRLPTQTNRFAPEILKQQNEIGKSKKCIFASLFLMNDGQEDGRIL